MRRLLLDANMSRGLLAALSDHRIETSHQMGWDSLGNGELLTAAETAGFDAMITADRNIQYQQNMAGRRIALVVLDTNHWPTIRDNLSVLVDAIARIQPGDYRHVSLPVPIRRPRRTRT
jgi:hypothetical protein